MDFNKFTQKSIEAIQLSQEIALKYGNPQVEEIHLHYSLVEQQDGLIPRVLSFLGENVDLIKEDIKREIEKLPKQQGGSLYQSQDYAKVLLNSEEEAKRFNDEYIGVEHTYISLLKLKGIKSEDIL